MCGLISAFYPDAVDPPSVDELKNGLEVSLETIKHRGPDSRGIYLSPDNRVGLGHVRLSIIDLASGQQPLSDEDDSIHCVVTGEIYDHDRIRAEMHSQRYSFKTKSDSELVVQLYKRDGFNLMSQLRGEFAFVLYDVKRRLLFAARDRFGIKPLYYTVSKGCILFGSEIKAFMGLGWQAEWDIESIVDNAELGDERTVFQGVRKLPAGYSAICRASGYIETQAYWDIPYPAATAPPPDTSIDAMVLRVRELLVEAVRLRLRSDVPLAVYLSGGIDSSAVAGIATQLLREKDPNAKLTTFTLAYSENEATDESPIAARTAELLGAELHKVEGTEGALVGAFEESVWHCEQIITMFHAAGKILLSKAVRDAGYKVALSGEGSDEVFGGYHWFGLDYLRDADPAGAALGLSLPSDAERLQTAEAYQVATRLPQLPSTAMGLHKSDGPRSLLRISAPLAIAGVFRCSASIFRPEVLARTGQPDLVRCTEEGLDPRVRQHSVSANWHSLNVALYFNARTLLPRVILNQAGDRADMVSAVESRVAFLDHHLVEYVATLPPSLKIMPIAGEKPGSWTLVEKWILREAVKPFVTEEIYRRKKIQYNPPPAQAPKVASDLVPLQKHLNARLTQASVERLGFIDWQFVRDQLAEYLESPIFPANGAMDPRASMLLRILSYIVLQERFHVPSFKL
ncbi:putative asparagine synthase [Mycena rosella]|uniref:Asparagine synthase n=1 Tax=Mycena rosella TaxID=1033263 RepID=A0AAD7GG92_MYCRO|nr:putative asparagine synthase [Mycena rosella]